MDLVIEVTRRCQIQCDHCLRGDAQDLDIKLSDIDKVLTGYINNLTFTGGEPSLNVKAIEYTLAMCKARDIEVYSCYIATNAVDISDAFLVACLRWYDYCEEMSVQHSNDNYHYNADSSMLKGLSFFSEKGNRMTLINQGRAYSNREAEDGEDMIYLNAQGKILKGCDYSYETQDNI